MPLVDIDASGLAAFGAKLAKRALSADAGVTAAVKHGAQDIKTAVRADLASSSNKAIARIPVSYEMKPTPTRVEADIAPQRGGAGSLANIAFFGTSRGGGTHRFYEHGEAEFETTAEYVRKAVIESW